MIKSWIEADLYDDMNTISDAILSGLKNDVDNHTFWADEIKKYKDMPEKRLKLALENLPLPAAFREAAIALRAIITSKKKINENFQTELVRIYDLACVYSFMLDYSKKLEGPGYNVMERVPGKYLFSLSKEYNILGYENLTLLTKTDIKIIKDYWGEPKKHQTMNKLYIDIWSKYEQVLLDERNKSKEELFSFIKNKS